MGPKPNNLNEFLTTLLTDEQGQRFLEVFRRSGVDVVDTIHVEYAQGRVPAFLFEGVMIYTHALRMENGAAIEVMQEYSGEPRPHIDPNDKEGRQMVDDIQRPLLTARNPRAMAEAIKELKGRFDESEAGQYAFRAQLNLALATMENSMIQGSMRDSSPPAQLKGWNMARRAPSLMKAINTHWLEPELKNARSDYSRAGSESLQATQHQQTMRQRVDYYETLTDFADVVSQRLQELRGHGGLE